MLDIKCIRDNTSFVEKGLAAKNARVDLPGLLRLDEQRRELLTRVLTDFALRRTRRMTKSAGVLRKSGILGKKSRR